MTLRGSQESHWNSFLADEKTIEPMVHNLPKGPGSHIATVRNLPKGPGSPKLHKGVVEPTVPGVPADTSRALIHKAATSSAGTPRPDLGLKGFQPGLLNPDEVDFHGLAYPYPHVISWERCPTGFLYTKCTYDVQKSQRRWYHEEVKKEDRVPMTPDVCYDFCHRIPGSQFFGLENGDRCYCTPFFHEDLSAYKEGRTETNAKWTGAGHFEGMCDMPCVGDATRMCGGKDLISMYGMHSCNPASTTTSRPSIALTTTTTPPCEPHTISIKATGPDVEMSKKSGEMYYGSSDLELGPDPGDPPWGQQLIGIRFQGLDVPIGARITEANVELTTITSSRRRASGNHRAPMKANIQMVRLPNVLPFGDSDHYLSRLPSTSEVSEWVLPDFVETAPNGPVQTPDIGRMVQEVVSQGGWKAGNAVAVTLESKGGPDDTALRRFESTEYAPPSLTVSYCALGGCHPTSISVTIQDDYDDVELFKNTGEMYMDSSDLELGMDHEWKDDGLVMIGLRFKQVEVPANARILSANIELTLDDVEDFEEPGTHDPITAVIKMILEPDVHPFGESDYYLSKLPATLAWVPWSPPDYGDIPGDYQYGGSGTPTDHTPDFGQLVQEVVSQGGWKAGNAMAVTLDPGTGDSEAVRRFWGAQLNKGPKLTIWFCAQS